MSNLTPEMLGGAGLGIGALVWLGIKLQPFISSMKVDVATDNSRRQHVDEMIRKEALRDDEIAKLHDKEVTSQREIGRLSAELAYLGRELAAAKDRIAEQSQRIIELQAMVRTLLARSEAGGAE